ncbi:hypothetical protein GCM10010343_76530 [Streptomyces avidinii]|uniref:Uncharacterized protein n=1 Tax=Streptomyces avidinii TaxID=1895 RepID=A0ABS4LIG7_STRAV|nr:hypothetical protein [Streptomyces avidinii]GGZ38469.1 hypothetical protein GCM10010343_76530 [Streptomyces avidinii]
MGDGETAEPGPEGVAEVEGCDVRRGGEGRGSGGLLHHTRLQRGHRGETDRAEGGQGDRGGYGGPRGEGEDHQYQAEAAEDEVQAGHQGPVGGPAAEYVAHAQPDPEEDEEPRDGAVGEAGQFRHHRGEVGEGGEDPAEAEDRRGQRQPHLGLAEDGEFTAQGPPFRRRLRRHQGDEAEQSDDPDTGHGPEGRAPPELLAQEGAQRYAEHIGQGEAGEHQGDGAGPPVGGHEVGGHDGPDPEERTVREGRDQTAAHQGGVVAGQGTEQVARDEDGHEHDEHGLARQPCTGRGHERCADDHTEGVAGDEHAGGGDGHGQVVGHFREQTDDDELGRPDAEGTDGEGEEGSAHRPVRPVAGCRRRRC